MLKRFIIKKYIMAKSAADAINKDKKADVEDVWVDDKWREMEDEVINKNEIGFKSGRKSVVQKTGQGSK